MAKKKFSILLNVNTLNFDGFKRLGFDSFTPLVRCGNRKVLDLYGTRGTFISIIATLTIPILLHDLKGTGGGFGRAMVLVTSIAGAYINLDTRARAYFACSRCRWGCLNFFLSFIMYLFCPLSPSLSLVKGSIWTEILSQRAAKPKPTEAEQSYLKIQEKVTGIDKFFDL